MAEKISTRLHRAWPRILVGMVGAALLAAALAKMIFPAAKSSVFGGLAHAAPWLAWTAIGIELVLAAWLISGWRAGAAAIAALLLFSFFSGVIAHDMLEHHPQPCGCFGLVWQQAHEPGEIERHLAFGFCSDIAVAVVLGTVLVAAGPAPKWREGTTSVKGAVDTAGPRIS
jgi:hypothetical protein